MSEIQVDKIRIKESIIDTSADLIVVKNSTDIDENGGLLKFIERNSLNITTREELLRANLSFDKLQTIFYKTLTAHTTFSFSNAINGNAIQLEMTGVFTIVFPTQFKQMQNSADYDGTKINVIYIFCSKNEVGAEVFDYVINYR